MIIPKTCTDAAGRSYWGQDEVDLESVDYVPPAPPLAVSQPTTSTRYVWVRIPPSWDGTQHRAPHRQLCCILEGTIEVTTSDGESRSFSVGDRFIMEDTEGEGHYTRNVETAAALVILVHFD